MQFQQLNDEHDYIQDDRQVDHHQQEEQKQNEQLNDELQQIQVENHQNDEPTEEFAPQASQILSRRRTITYNQSRQAVRPRQIVDQILGQCVTVVKICVVISMGYVIKNSNVKQQRTINEQQWLLHLLEYFLIAYSIELVYKLLVACFGHTAFCSRNSQCMPFYLIVLFAIYVYIWRWMIIGFYINDELPPYSATDSNFIHYLYIFYLVWGAFQIFCVGCICCIICVIATTAAKDSRNKTNKINEIKQKLKGVPYSKQILKTESTCPICLNEYKPEDLIVQLKCHESHIFHDSCIEDWVKAGHTNCPNCRKQIEF